MRHVLAILTSVTVWACLGSICGYYIGSKAGYQRGVRDIGAIVIMLREVEHPPEPFTEGEI